MCGGDKDGPDPTNPMVQANADIKLERERARIAEENRVKEEMRSAAERTRLQGEFDSRMNDAYGGGLDYAQALLGQRGLSWDEFGDPIKQEFGNVKRSIPNLDSNPGKYFGSDLVDTVLNRIRDTRRDKYGQEVQRNFGAGFEKNYIGDEFDDSVIDSIYNEQYQDASTALNRAAARGNLSPLGFSLAQRQLETQGKAGKSRLQSLGGGVLDKYRSELGGIANQASGEASRYRLGDTFDFGKFNTLLGTKKNEFGTRLEGDVRDATRGENAFNVEEIIGKAGQQQGLYNPSTADVSGSPIFNALKSRGADRRKQRGLASAGSTF